MTRDLLAAAPFERQRDGGANPGRALDGDAGRRLLAHLERRYLAHTLAPSASDAELRHLEGQRSVVLYLHHLLATARRGPSGDQP